MAGAALLAAEREDPATVAVSRAGIHLLGTTTTAVNSGATLLDACAAAEPAGSGSPFGTVS